jgi:predicted lipoprotein with Yx(FWY)xxD motif
MADTSKHRYLYRALAGLAALALPLGVAAAQAGSASAQAAQNAHAATAKSTPKGTEITVANTVFGPALIVGSGPFKGFSLYFLSWDKPPVYGCTTGATKTPVGPITCTGPSNDKNAEWPAITTTGKPIAGPGVSGKLLGTVYRKGVGTQITYAGHPLYLLDQQSGQVSGEGWFEPGLPPWFGVWWLMSPGGYPVPWAGTLTTTKVGGKTVLAAQYETGAGWVNFPLYTFSADSSSSAVCSANAACARAWPPVTTGGAPGWLGVPASQIGSLGIPGNLTQVSWAGRPLYLFSHEQLTLGPNGMPVALGNGNGIKAFGGTFSLVVNP